MIVVVSSANKTGTQVMFLGSQHCPHLGCHLPLSCLVRCNCNSKSIHFTYVPVSG